MKNKKEKKYVRVNHETNDPEDNANFYYKVTKNKDCTISKDLELSEWKIINHGNGITIKFFSCVEDLEFDYCQWEEFKVAILLSDHINDMNSPIELVTETAEVL